jgi:hypothetical protein
MFVCVLNFGIFVCSRVFFWNNTISNVSVFLRTILQKELHIDDRNCIL